MPKLELSVNTELSLEVTSRLAADLTKLTHKLLNKQPEETRISVSQCQVLHFGNGKLLSEPNTFDLVIYITEDTNTEEEKAKWLSASNNL